MDEERFSHVIETNLTASFRVAKRALPAMLKARRGRIIFVSSVVGFMGNAGQANYATRQKAGLIQFARAHFRVGSLHVSITVNVTLPRA